MCSLLWDAVCVSALTSLVLKEINIHFFTCLKIYIIYRAHGDCSVGGVHNLTHRPPPPPKGFHWLFTGFSLFTDFSLAFHFSLTSHWLFTGFSLAFYWLFTFLLTFHWLFTFY